jgi:hypothetical protein
MRASWPGSDAVAAGAGEVGAAAGALDGGGDAGTPPSSAALDRASSRRVTRAGAIGFTGEVYIGYAPRS